MKFVDGFQLVLGCGHRQTDREWMHHLIAQEQQNSDGEDISLPSHASCSCKLMQSATKNWFDPLSVEEISDQDDGDFIGSINESKSSVTSSESSSERDGFEFIGNAEVCPSISWECINWCFIFFSLETAFPPKWSLLIRMVSRPKPRPNKLPRNALKAWTSCPQMLLHPSATVQQLGTSNMMMQTLLALPLSHALYLWPASYPPLLFHLLPPQMLQMLKYVCL